MPPDSGRPDPQHHRALASVSRVRILDLLRDEGRPVTAKAVAEQVGLHLTTVREHLEMLVGAGLVTKSTHRREGRGRPPLLYSAVRSSATHEGYKLLATVLAEQLEELGAETEHGSEAAGRRLGSALTKASEGPLEGRSRVEVLRLITRLMAELGFAPELVVDDDSARILLHRCPFADLARRHTDVVCGVHLGLIRGALRELGAADAAASLTPFVEPELCLVEIGGGPPEEP